MPDHIFVSVANYRDQETPFTLRDLFAKARYPERIRVGVLDQYLKEDIPWSMNELPGKQIRRLMVSAQESQGVCWARSLILTELRADETYVLQIDSHSRFSPGWDDRFIEMLKTCPSPKSVLSTYPVGYNPPDEYHPLCIPVLVGYKYHAPSILLFHTTTLDYRARPSIPIPNAFVGGSCIFTRAEAFDQVPYDPYIYFHGEEISLSARLWTHGWDIYAPNDVLLFHDYTNNRGRVRNWDDNMEWFPMAERSFKRIRHLFGVELSDDPRAIERLDDFGLGGVRTLCEFESFADICFSKNEIGARASSGRFAL